MTDHVIQNAMNGFKKLIPLFNNRKVIYRKGDRHTEAFITEVAADVMGIHAKLQFLSGDDFPNSEKEIFISAVWEYFIFDKSIWHGLYLGWKVEFNSQ